MENTAEQNQINGIDNKKSVMRQKHNKNYYERNKQAIISYVIEYNANRRETNIEYKKRINEYYRNKYNCDDEARQKKREYYLKRKQLNQMNELLHHNKTII